MEDVPILLINVNRNSNVLRFDNNTDFSLEIGLDGSIRYTDVDVISLKENLRLLRKYHAMSRERDGGKGKTLGERFFDKLSPTQDKKLRKFLFSYMTKKEKLVYLIQRTVHVISNSYLFMVKASPSIIRKFLPFG